MNNKTKNSLLFAFEIGAFGLGLVCFLILNFFFDVKEEIANIIYIVFILISFGWLYSFEFIFKSYKNMKNREVCLYVFPFPIE